MYILELQANQDDSPLGFYLGPNHTYTLDPSEAMSFHSKEGAMILATLLPYPKAYHWNVAKEA